MEGIHFKYDLYFQDLKIYPFEIIRTKNFFLILLHDLNLLSITQVT